MPDQAPDPQAQWWTLADVAAYLGVKLETVHRYRKRPRDKGGLPPEDDKVGRTPVYYPATVIGWNERERLGKGARTDLGRSAGPRS